MPKFKYPETPTVDQVDDFHGTSIPDPYRWLEDVDSPETLSWIAAQNKLTFTILEQIPARARILQRLTALWDFPKPTAPRKRGGRYFQMHNTASRTRMSYSLKNRYATKSGSCSTPTCCRKMELSP